jgi:internalin A
LVPANDTSAVLEPRKAQRTTVINLSSQNLTEVPQHLIQLSNLQTVTLIDNQLTELPAEIGQLTGLRILVLNENQLTGLPAEIGQLTGLRTLWLDGNRLTGLPAEIGQLTGLRTLWLDGNRLTGLPAEIGQLTGLRTLWLDGNRLTGLPSEIGQLTRLRTVMLSGNQLTGLPPEIGQLSRLEELRLDGNQLTGLPAEIGRLTGLRTLLVDGNQLTRLPPEIGQLTNLRTLLVDGNQLTRLPPEIGQLTNLRELSLAANQLTELPPEIGQLTNLQRLTLDDNQLTELPRQLANSLTKGLVLELSGNPLKEPLPDLVKRGMDAVATYLRSLEGAIPQYDAKLLLVGEGNVGKTSLSAALRDAPFVKERSTTHGIEIKPLTVPHPNPSLEVDMTMRAWDFGGQEAYRISHQFFFSRRAIYLVVWKAREGQEQNEVAGWLRRIRLRVSQDACVLVVATHCQERRPDLEYPQLRRAFPELLAGQYEVDNSTGFGIPELRDGIAVEAAQLPQMGQMISPRWIAARDEILALAETEPQISYQGFVEACQRHHVYGDEIGTLAELMHDLGQIVYYGSDESLRDFVVLDPEWLTRAISYVLEDEPTRQSNGFLDHSRLTGIWQVRQHGLTYPSSYHPYFLRLMEKFDVSYRVDDDGHRSLVTQLVQHDRPDLPWDTCIPPPDGIRSLALICKLSEPVPGLISWLTVRHHRASTEKHWRTGVFLRHPITSYASEALMEVRTLNQLRLDVRAPSPDFYFNVLRDSIEDLITRRWPGLEYELLIPCPTRAADRNSCLGQFPLEGLLRYREDGGGPVRCWTCGTNHDLSQLLTGFAQPDLPLQFELEQIHHRIADIGSGVGRLEDYAAKTADSVRRVLRAVSTEVTDCPRLFTLTYERPVGLRFLKFYLRHYRIVLWCEHPGGEHPWPPATYSLDQPRGWLIRIGPYATLVFKTLQVAIPHLSSVTDILTEAQLKHAQNGLEQMETLITALPHGSIEDESELIEHEYASQLSPAQGQALRGIRVVLFRHDHTRAFGDLRRVQAPSGDFLWVCANHYVDYDPGLPSIPGSQP